MKYLTPKAFCSCFSSLTLFQDSAHDSAGQCSASAPLPSATHMATNEGSEATDDYGDVGVERLNGAWEWW